jgi:ADP-heptose:LPS heptosyltransferase
MPGVNHILVMRFSAMGDVAMTVPVVKALLDQNPHVRITYVSRPEYGDFFKDIPRLSYFAADVAALYAGLPGLLKLYLDLKKNANYYALADLHNNLRTQVLRKLFRLSGVPYIFIDKGRAEKKLLTRFPNKLLKPLKLMVERYADVFRKIGLQLTLDHQLVKQPKILSAEVIEITGTKSGQWTGISPFAKHKGKTYPHEKMEQLIAELSQTAVKIFLFGGGQQEREICYNWQKKYANVISTVQLLSMEQELALMSQLDVMLSMDSSGMHLASLVGTPVVSIWGATHHFAGFLGYGQSTDDIVANDIECRPCSVYGNKPCFRKDYVCMHRIKTDLVIEKLTRYINQKN